MIAPLLNVDALAQHFERKLQKQLAALPSGHDETLLCVSDDHCQCCGRIQTLGDARRVLGSHAMDLARREAVILATVAIALKLHPEQDADGNEIGTVIPANQIPTIIARWHWTVWGEEQPEDMGLPRALGAVQAAAAGVEQNALPDDFDIDELAAWLRSRCPARVVDYSTKTCNGSTLGEHLPDCHRLSTTLMIHSHVSTEQLAWLYASVEPATAREGLQQIRQATQILSVLGSVSKGDAQRRLLDVVVPEALRNANAQGRVADERVRDDLASAVRRNVSGLQEHIKRHTELPDIGCESLRRAYDLETTSEAELIAALYSDIGALAGHLAKSYDGAFASYLERLGKEGKEVAKMLRRTDCERVGKEAWKLWRYRPEGERYLVYLATVLWVEQVEPETRYRESRRPSAVVRAVSHDRLLLPMTRRVSLPVNDDDLARGGHVRDERGRVVATVSLTTEATLVAVRRGYQALGSVSGHLLIRNLIHRAADAWNRGDPDPRKVSFPGGWTGLLDEIGVARKAQQQVKDIAQAGQCIAWSTPQITHGGLWTWSERRGTRAGSGEVAFVLGEALTPGYGSELARTGGKGQQARIARRLVPELRLPPPMGGARANDRGPIWTLHRLLVIELVDHAEALHVHGAVEIAQVRWGELADIARLTRKILDRTLDAWIQGDGDSAPALVERQGRDHWTLASPHRLERDFIADGGARRVRGRQRAGKA